MIVAHHMGEQLLPVLAAAGAGSGPVLLLVLRERLRASARSCFRRGRDTMGRSLAAWQRAISRVHNVRGYES